MIKVIITTNPSVVDLDTARIWEPLTGLFPSTKHVKNNINPRTMTPCTRSVTTEAGNPDNMV